MVCVEVVSGSLSPGLTAVISLSTRDGTAVGESQIFPGEAEFHFYDDPSQHLVTTPL